MIRIIIQSDTNKSGKAMSFRILLKPSKLLIKKNLVLGKLQQCFQMLFKFQ